jgi:hypothetical protein
MTHSWGISIRLDLGSHLIATLNCQDIKGSLKRKWPTVRKVKTIAKQ